MLIDRVLRNKWFIAVIAALLFIPFLGHVHLFDWDEINFAESAREMIESGDYFSVQINYQRFWEKPPLFFWMQVLSMKIFGINEFAARFPNAVCGITSLLVFYHLGKKLFSVQLARIWVMVYLGTFLTFLYFKTGIIDPWFNLFIFLSVVQLYFLSVATEKHYKHAILSGLFLGLAVLTKGPVAILIVLLTGLVMLFMRRGKLGINIRHIATLALTGLVVCFLWFGVDLVENGPWFLGEFIRYQIRLLTTGDAGHGQPFFYHWVVLLIGCFPASIFFIRGLKIPMLDPAQRDFRTWMLVLFWVHLLLFSLVKTKIVHYSSLCWLPLCFISALTIDYLLLRRKDLGKPLRILLGFMGILLGLVITGLPFLMMARGSWIHLVKDPFAVANFGATVNWKWYDGLAGLLLLAGVIYYLRGRSVLRAFWLFASVTACCLLTAILITPKIEAFSQRANIEFFQSLKGKQVYAETYGYKSFAQYFYAEKKYGSSPVSMDSLLYAPLDRPVYFSAKINRTGILDSLPQVKKLYEKNGFVFYLRQPQ